MSTPTTNYSLTKPEETEFYDIAVQNANLDVIDSSMHTNAQDIANTDSQVSTNTQAITNINTQVSTNAQDITDINTQVSTNTQDITALEQKNTLVAEVILDVETTSIVIDDLDINADGGIYDFWFSSSSNAAATIMMYINTDDTRTNYYLQYLQASDGSISGTRTTSPGISVIFTQTTAVGNIIRNPVTGHALGRADTIYRGGSDLTARSYIMSSVNTFANITKLTFTNSQGFDVGTILKIYKR